MVDGRTLPTVHSAAVDASFFGLTTGRISQWLPLRVRKPTRSGCSLAPLRAITRRLRSAACCSAASDGDDVAGSENTPLMALPARRRDGLLRSCTSTARNARNARWLARDCGRQKRRILVEMWKTLMRYLLKWTTNYAVETESSVNEHSMFWTVRIRLIWCMCAVGNRRIIPMERRTTSRGFWAVCNGRGVAALVALLGRTASESHRN